MKGVRLLTPTVAAGRKSIVTIAIPFMDWLSDFTTWLSCWLTALKACTHWALALAIRSRYIGPDLTRLMVFCTRLSMLCTRSLQPSSRLSLCWSSPCTLRIISYAWALWGWAISSRCFSYMWFAVEYAALELSYRYMICFAILWIPTKSNCNLDALRWTDCNTVLSQLVHLSCLMTGMTDMLHHPKYQQYFTYGSIDLSKYVVQYNY